MAKNWRKFDFDELIYLWNGHKQRNINTDPLRMHGITAGHRQIQLTQEEIEDLVDVLLEKLMRAKDCIEGNC